MSTTTQLKQSPEPILPESRLHAIDAAMHADKLADGYGQRNQANALRLQINMQDKA